MWMACAAPGQQAYFLPLGDLPGGDVFSTGADISPDGLFVVGGSDSGTGHLFSEPYRWSEIGMEGLGFLPDGAPTGDADAVSRGGRWVVGTAASAQGPQAFLWSERDGMIGIGDLPGGEYQSHAFDVSSSGRVVVGESDSANNYADAHEAFIWTPEDGMRGLGFLGPSARPISSASAVSGDGRIVVGVSTNADGFDEAFRWTEDNGMVGLGTLDSSAFQSDARGISPDGKWIVGESTERVDGRRTREAVVWTPQGEIQGLGWLSDGNRRGSIALDVSNGGRVVVGRSYADSSGRVEAFVWTPEWGMRSIAEVLLSDHGIDTEAMGWRLDSANAVSADGSLIVGTGFYQDDLGFHTEAWLVHLPIPAPSTIAVLAPVLTLAARRHRDSDVRR